MPERSEQNSFEHKKVKYFSDFALRHREQIKILQKGKVLGKENRDWRNVSEHCLFEAVNADILAEALGADRERVVGATLLHDWFKREEVNLMKTHGPKEGGRIVREQERERLEEHGVPNDMITLITETIIPETSDQQELSQRSAEQKILHFIDTVTFDTDLIDFRERLDVTKQRPGRVEFSETFRSQYGGKSLLEVQAEVAQAEQAEFEETLGLERGALLDFLRSRLYERIVAG